MKRQSLFKIITILFGILIGAIIAEIGFRFYHSLQYDDLKEIAAEKRPPIQEPNKELKLGQIIQLSANPKIIYELIPSSTYHFKKTSVTTNKFGFRGKEFPIIKEEKTKRIIGLGDSVMFGWGIEQEDIYLSRLEAHLNKSDSVHFEIINTGVPGYNTVMELATLKEKFDLEAVDLVLLNFVPNDFDLPDFIRKKPDYWGTKKSFILQQFEDYAGFDKRLRTAPFDKENFGFQRDSSKVPAEYRNMVGQSSFQKAVTELKDLSKKYGFRVIVFPQNPTSPLPTFVQTLCTEFAFETVQLESYWMDYKQKNPAAEWSLSETDFHPSKHGHFVLAKALEEKISPADW